MIKYNKLFAKLAYDGKKKTDLLGVNSHTLAKMSKGETVNTDTINKICYVLDCQPADIMEYVPVENEKILSGLEQLKSMFNAGMHEFDNSTKEEMKDVKKTIKKAKNDGLKAAEKLNIK